MSHRTGPQHRNAPIASTRRAGRVAALTALAATGLITLAACSSSAQPAKTPASTPATTQSTTAQSTSVGASSAGSSAPASEKLITIKDFAYHGPASVSPGAKVTVMNKDSTAHTVTADGSGGFDVTVAPGKSATFTAPAKAGSYPYHCTFHANMHGTLIVK